MDELTQENINRKLKSGDYTLTNGKKLIYSSVFEIYDFVNQQGLNYLLDIWLNCWRAYHYGMPGSHLVEHGFDNTSHVHFGEDDPIFIKRIQYNRKVYNKWIKLCQKYRLHYPSFEWLFLGAARTQKELSERMGSREDVNRTIVVGFRLFQRAFDEE